MSTNQFTVKDLATTAKTQKMANYCGEYNLDEFWAEYGKHYLKTMLDKDGNPNEESLKLNIRGLVSRLFELSPKSVLEVGCGFGRCFPFIYDSLRGNGKKLDELIGIEFSETMVEQSNLYFESYANKHKVSVIRGDARAIPFPGKRFDVVYTHACLTHIPPEFIEGITKEISRVAKDYIIHIERYRFPYEHPNPHRWTHCLAPLYLKLGWRILENNTLNEKHYTNILVLRK